MICAKCGDAFDRAKGYAVLWLLDENGTRLYMRYVCMPCSNSPEYEDVTAEVIAREQHR